MVSLALNSPPRTENADERDGRHPSKRGAHVCATWDVQRGSAGRWTSRNILIRLRRTQNDAQVGTGRNSKSYLVTMNAAHPTLQTVHDHKKTTDDGRLSLRGYQLRVIRLVDCRVVCPNATGPSRISDASASFATLIPLLIEAQALPGIGTSASKRSHCRGHAPFGA